MVFRSNLQSVRIGWGLDWKNRWISPLQIMYKDYLWHDLFLQKYFEIKFIEDTKKNVPHAYNYDFFFEKTFFYNKIILERYNIDFSWLSQLAHSAYFNKLKIGANYTEDNLFYRLSMGNENFMNFFIWPELFFLFYNLYVQRKVSKNFWHLQKNINFYERPPRSILLGLKTASFFIDSVFNRQNEFFLKPCFNFYNEMFEGFYNKHVPQNLFVKNPVWVHENRFTLANFLFNPQILKKYPSFIFVYQNWLNWSWVASKRSMLTAMAVAKSYADPISDALHSLWYFCCRLMQFLLIMRQVNLHVQGNDESGFGISHEFLERQKMLFYLRLGIWEIMLNCIWKVWSYFKAYLKYFSYENKVKVFWSRRAFTRMFFFKKFLWSVATGFKFNGRSLFFFIKKFFYVKTFWKKKLFGILNSFLNNPELIYNWYVFWSGIFWMVLDIVKKIVKKWKLTLFKKISLIYGFSNFLIWFFGFNQMSFGSFVPISFKAIVYKMLFIVTNYELSYFLRLRKVLFSVDTFIYYLFLDSYTEISDIHNEYMQISWVHNHLFETNFSETSLTKKISFYDYLNFSDLFCSVKWLVRLSDWLTLCFISPYMIKVFYAYIYFKRTFWKKKLKYFYYFISNLSIKNFFWMIWDFWQLVNFNLLMHSMIIFWQNFFFYYYYVLKCLRRMYSLCEYFKQLFLSWPVKLFLQKERWEIALFDFFSTSFSYFGAFAQMPFYKYYNPEKEGFTIIDFSYGLAGLGKPNCWMLDTTDEFYCFNKFSLYDKCFDSPFFIPMFNIQKTFNFFFKRKKKIYFTKKIKLNFNEPYFSLRVPSYVKIKHFSNLYLTSNLIATFVWKKLEKEHLLVEVLRGLNLLLWQADMIWGFMFLLKGRFSRRQRASKIWIWRGKLSLPNKWNRVDFCKMPATLKYGAVSIWIWMVIDVMLNDVWAFV